MEAKTPYDYLQTTINGTSLRNAYLNGKQAGIREVVEWIEGDNYEVNQRACSLGDIPVFLIHKESWQAKLKEWGIKDGFTTNITKE